MNEPIVVYLQTGPDPHIPPEDDFNDCHEVTWADDRAIPGHVGPYVHLPWLIANIDNLERDVRAAHPLPGITSDAIRGHLLGVISAEIMLGECDGERISKEFIENLSLERYESDVSSEDDT